MKLQTLFALVGMVCGMNAFALPMGAQEQGIEMAVFADAGRGEFKCPAPHEVKCRSYAESVGAWTQNGGARVSANTTFLPNNQCANVIPINENGMSSRLLCCYKECGVLYQDVKFRDCKKVSVSEFRCQ